MMTGQVTLREEERSAMGEEAMIERSAQIAIAGSMIVPEGNMGTTKAIGLPGGMMSGQEEKALTGLIGPMMRDAWSTGTVMSARVSALMRE